MHELPPARLLVAAPRGGTAAIAEDRSAMTRRPSESPLPLDAAPRVRHGKAVMPQAEDAAVHDAVLALRRATRSAGASSPLGSCWHGRPFEGIAVHARKRRNAARRSPAGRMTKASLSCLSPMSDQDLREISLEGALVTPDCQSCGACCVEDLARPVVPSDPTPRYLTRSVRGAMGFTRDEAGHVRQMGSDAAGRCLAFRGEPGSSCRCSIYERRPAVCSTFEPGNDLCLQARQELGL